MFGFMIGIAIVYVIGICLWAATYVFLWDAAQFDHPRRVKEANRRLFAQKALMAPIWPIGLASNLLHLLHRIQVDATDEQHQEQS